MKDIIQKIRELSTAGTGTLCYATQSTCPSVRKSGRVLIALDGRAAAGKSTLAARLAEELPCTVFHMDDFYLRPEQRTEARYATPGGNVDYERFRAEVLEPLANGAATIQLAVFDCASMSVQKPERITVPSDGIVLCEGAYACHPKLVDFYDVKLFYDIAPELQKERILKRNGPKKLEEFLTRWIPLEEAYLSAYPIKETADLVL